MSPKSGSLRRNFLWTLSGNTVYAACMWGILAVLTKLGSPELVGRFALGAAVAAPIIMFSNLQLRPVIAADAADTNSFSEYLGVRLIMLPAAFIVAAVVAVAGYSGAQVAVVLALALARTVESVGDLFYGYFQKHDRMHIVSRSLVIKGLATLILFSAVFHVTSSLVAAVGAMSLAYLVPLLSFDIPRARRLMIEVEGHARLRPRWNRDAFVRIVSATLPLGFVMLLIQLRNSVPRTLLEKEWGEGELGMFAAMSYLTVIGTMFVTALGQSIIARLARAYTEGDVTSYRRYVGHLFKLGAVLGLVGVGLAWLAGGRILGLLYSPSYAERVDVFVIVMVAGGFLYISSLVAAPLTASRSYGTQLWIQGVNVLILLGVGLVLIPRSGMSGAAWTLVAGSAWLAAAHGVAAWRSVKNLERRASLSG